MGKGGGKKSAAARAAANRLLADNRLARHQYEILEDYPSLIAVTFRDIALMKIHVGSNLLNLPDFIRGLEGTSQRQRRHERKQSGFHEATVVAQ